MTDNSLCVSAVTEQFQQLVILVQMQTHTAIGLSRDKTDCEHTITICRRYLGSAASPSGDDSDMSEAIDLTETRATPLGSFPAIFSQAIALGTLSRREIYAQAQRSSAEGTGRGFGNLRTAEAAATTAEAADFHWHLARADGLREAKVATVPRHWRWRVRHTIISFTCCIYHTTGIV